MAAKARGPTSQRADSQIAGRENVRDSGRYVAKRDRNPINVGRLERRYGIDIDDAPGLQDDPIIKSGRDRGKCARADQVTGCAKLDIVPRLSP